jgi:hypothetical protein
MRQCLALGDMPDELFVIAGTSAESWPDFSVSTAIGLTCWCSGWPAVACRRPTRWRRWVLRSTCSWCAGSVSWAARSWPLGVIASNGVIVINDDVVRGLGIVPETIQQVSDEEGY